MPIDFVTLLADSNFGGSTWKLSFCIATTPTIVQDFKQFLNYWLVSKISNQYSARSVNDKTYHVVTQYVQETEIKDQLLVML